VWVLGNLVIDDLVTWDGHTRMGLCGGNAVFAALGARLWAERVGLAARVGPDFPSEFLDQLQEAGIQLELATTAAPSLHHWALYESPEQRQFVRWLGSGSQLEQSLGASEVPQAARQARAVHIAPMPFDVQRQLVESFSEAPTLVMLDPHDEHIAGHQDELLETLRHVEVFLPSRQEAALLFGADQPEAAARALLQLQAGPRVVVIKLGAAGSLVVSRDMQQPVYVPRVEVDAVDPTGAGDAYCGAFAAAYATTANALHAARAATVAASFVVERRGALALLPLDRARAQARLRALESATMSA
jgi:ribokinase